MSSSPDLSATQRDLVALGEEIVGLLVAKNRRYGDSALEPIRVFSAADPVEQLRVRLDDKLSRMRSAQSDDDEDVLIDLIGYLFLLVLARRRRDRTRGRD